MVFEARLAPDIRGELRSRTRRHSRQFDPFAMSSGNDRFLRKRDFRIWSTFDVDRTLQIAAADVALGRKAGLQGSPLEEP